MREFHKTARTGKTQVWRIEAVGDQVITEYGELKGAIQRVTDTAQEKNVGRSNYVSPEESAIQQMERQILLKEREGYVEIGGSGTDVIIDDRIYFTKNLPQNLCFYKPANSMSPVMENKIASGSVLFTRKRDGEMMVIVKNGFGTVDIYSRRMLISHDKEKDAGWEWRHRFMDIVEEIEDNADIPNGTIFLGEMVSDYDTDDRKYVASIMKSLTPRALEIQEKDRPLKYCCWDVSHVDMKDVITETPYEDRRKSIETMLNGMTTVFPVEFFTSDAMTKKAKYYLQEATNGWPNGKPASWDDEKSATWNAACAYAVQKGWEGFVVVALYSPYGDKSYNFRGKPDRPSNKCCKLKPEYEDDFIALFDPEGTETGDPVGKWGRGKRQNQVGSVTLYQYNSAGVLTEICDCGGGIIKTDEFAEKYSDPASYPMVIKVLYSDRTYVSEGDDTNALQFPRAVEIRDDKSPEECINPRL